MQYRNKNFILICKLVQQVIQMEGLNKRTDGQKHVNFLLTKFKTQTQRIPHTAQTDRRSDMVDETKSFF